MGTARLAAFEEMVTYLVAARANLRMAIDAAKAADHLHIAAEWMSADDKLRVSEQLYRAAISNARHAVMVGL